MKLSLFGRLAMALFASLTLGLGMTACGGGTIGYMWVLGQQYNQISGFKIDDFTGNLTQIPGAPFATNGVTPVSIAVKPGGRYVFVLNQGTGGSQSSKGTSSGVSVFSVGGDGTLTFQQAYQSQGYIPQWLQMDSTGSYLFVLDKYSPTLNTTTGLYTGANTDGNGSITVFAVDSNTGRLQLVQNTQTLNGTVATPFFKVGPTPFMMKTAGGCLLTVNSNNTISPFSFGGNGQLVIPATSSIPTSTTTVTSINYGASYVFLTDAGTNKIFSYTVGSGCGTLTPVSTGSTPNITGTSNPSYSFVDSTGKYVYILNQTTTSSTVGTPYSSISAFTIQSNGQLQSIAGAPYTVGSNPVCMVEDPTNQYMYISNRNDGTVTGKVLDPTTGILSPLSRGSTFTASGIGACIGVSGAY